MPSVPWSVRAAFGVTASVALFAGCSSGSSSAPTPAVTVTETAPAAPTAQAPTSAPTVAPPTGGGAELPPTPAGATEIHSKTLGGVVYGHYKISGQTPKSVVKGYESTFKADGYSIVNAGGSGGGWGKWGGSGYGMDAAKAASYASVQAGGENSGPTYFEVCVGPNKNAVDKCDNHSNQHNHSNSQGS